MRTLVIWGAGRIGRGFVADLFHEPGWRIVFVDIDRALVDRLNERGAYTIFKATAAGISRTRVEGGFTALHTSQTDALKRLFAEEGLMLDIAVHEPKLPEVADMIAPLLEARFKENAGPMDIMMNVNMTSPDAAFTRLLEARLDGEALACLRERVGITGIAAMCISPVATEAMFREDPLAVLNNAWPEQAIGAPQLKGEKPRLPRVRLSADVHAEETRKLYTLNMAHALCCYLGTRRGYRTVIEAMGDGALRARVAQALEESSLGLSRAFGFPAEEMAAWRAAIIGLLDNPSIDDNLPRLGADSRRKLSHDDRLCAPARLCLEAGGRPDAIVSAIRAGFEFCHDDPGTNDVRARVERDGLPSAVASVCGLDENDALYRMILDCKPD
ncbi:MAG: hypothetical protein J5998_12355 [Clostridia bacterium]|nr:hypothetical protein [Clostridia bacterium]MBR4727947.1 hypothetical protein [Clostridia bacterium]